MTTKNTSVKQAKTIGDASAIRTALMKNARFRLEFIAMVSRLCREHSVAVTEETLSELTLAVEPELMKGMSSVALD